MLLDKLDMLHVIMSFTTSSDHVTGIVAFAVDDLDMSFHLLMSWKL